MWDAAGRRYLDATSGAFCVNLGYSRPDLVRAMAEAAARLPHARPSRFESEEGQAYRAASIYGYRCIDWHPPAGPVETGLESL